MRTKKVLSAVLSLSLIVGSVSGSFFGGTKSSAAEAEKIVVYVAAQGETGEGETKKTVEIGKTPVQLENGSTAKDAIKKVLDKSAYKNNYVISENDWGGSLDAIGDVAQTSDYSYYWNFCVNNIAASVGIGTYELQPNDKISLIYGSYDPSAATQCDCYADDETLNPDAAAQELLVENAKKQQTVLAKKIFEAQFDNGKTIPGIEDASGLYTVFSLAQAGFENIAFYDAVYAKILAQFGALKSEGKVYDVATDQDITFASIEKSSNYPSLFYAKIALCLSALGRDITDIGGVNLLEKLVDKDIYEASKQVFSTSSMILFAVDAKQSELPVGDNYLTRADLVNAVLAGVDTQIDVAISWGSSDTAAMAIQAIAPYAKKDTAGIDTGSVKVARDKVLKFLATWQDADGTFAGYNPNDPWALSQVMVALNMSDEDALSETSYDFIKNGKTVFDAASTFVDVSTEKVNEQLMKYQPEQLLRALNAGIRTAENQNKIYDTTSVEYTASNSTKTALTADMVSKIADQTYTGNVCTPAVTVSVNGKALMLDQDYTVSYKNNTAVGTASVIVTGMGEYLLSQKVFFHIVKKTETAGTNNDTTNNNTTNNNTTNKDTTSTKKVTLKKPVVSKLTSSKKKTLTVKVKKVTNAKKYVVEISTNKKFKKNVMKKTVKTTKKTFIVTFKKLKSKKKYYVRVRAYNGSKKSAYSKTYNKKVK